MLNVKVIGPVLLLLVVCLAVGFSVNHKQKKLEKQLLECQAQLPKPEVKAEEPKAADAAKPAEPVKAPEKGK